MYQALGHIFSIQSVGSRYFFSIESLLKKTQTRGVSVYKLHVVFVVIHENLKNQYGLPLITKKITRGSLILFSISIFPHEKYASCFRGLSVCVGGRCDLEPLLLAHYIQ